MNQAERWLQAEVWLQLESERRRGNLRCVVVPIPNGVWIPARTEEERKLVKRIIRRMVDEGQMLPGAFDFGVFWDIGSGLIELKRPAEDRLHPVEQMVLDDLLRDAGVPVKRRRSPAGRPSQVQKDFGALCDAHGVRRAYAESWAQVRAALVEWGRLR